MRNLKTSLYKLSSARPALWVGVPLSLAVGMVLFFTTATSIETESRVRFTSHAQNARNTISARLKSYTDALRGTASVFQIGYPLSRQQFHGYISGLDLATNFPALINVNYATSVTDAQRDAFEAQVRSEHLADGRALDQFSIMPPGRRPLYQVTTFVEPEARWAGTLGLDVYANPLIQPTFDHLRDSGELVASGMPIPIISQPNHIGLAMRLPVYRPGFPTSTVEERRIASIGSVGIAFSVQRLLQGVIDEIPVKNVRMTLVDKALGVDRQRGRVLFDSLTGRPAALFDLKPYERFTTTMPIDFHGRSWEATFSVAASEMYSGFEEFIPWLMLLAGFVSSMLLYALFQTLSSSRQRAIRMAKEMTRELRDSQDKLQLSHENLRRLAAHAEQIKEGERKRIAREIHDDLGQNLLALRIEADMLCSRTGAHHPRLNARARSTLSQIDTTIKSVRQIINDLRPNVLDLGLSAAVEWQLAEFKRRTGIDCELLDESKEMRLGDHAATALFRILQESLSNIVRHAQASQVRIKLAMAGSRLSMTVSDNGVGLGANERNKDGSFGLVGIEERISILGGNCSIVGTEGKGTTVCVSVPVLPVLLPDALLDDASWDSTEPGPSHVS